MSDFCNTFLILNYLITKEISLNLSPTTSTPSKTPNQGNKEDLTLAMWDLFHPFQEREQSKQQSLPNTSCQRAEFLTLSPQTISDEGV